MELIPRVITDEENWILKIKSIEVTNGGGDKKIPADLEATLDGDNIVCTGDGIKIIYSNSESGIEQNIIITEKSETVGIDFIIETEDLNISQENDRFVLSSNEAEIVFQINKVEDADGKELSYSLSGDESKLSISLNDNNLAYPIKIITGITSDNSSIEDLSISPSAKVRGLSEIPDWTADSHLFRESKSIQIRKTT